MQRLQGLLMVCGLAMAMASSAGCDGTTATDGGTDAGQVGECQRSFHCEAGAICEKPPGAGLEDYGVCVKILCTADADCGEQELCDLRRGLCVSENLCDPGNPGDKCGDGEYCIYQDGQPLCVAETELPGAAGCDLAPNPAYLASGGSLMLSAVGKDANGKLVPNASFSFSANGVGTVAGNVLSAECGAAQTCTGTVTATSGAASCSADVTVYGAVDGFRVTVIDTTNKTPVQGATVALKVAGDATLLTETTGPTGQVVFPTPAGAVEAVSTFPAGHHWQTILNPPSTDILLATTPVPDDTKVAAVKGKFDFSQVSTQGDIQLGLAGTSFRTSMVDIDFLNLVGEVADYQVPEEVEGLPFDSAPLPAGLTIRIGESPIKETFVAVGDKGQRVLWALGGKVRLAELSDIISGVTTDEDINAGSLLSAVLPFFAKFDHGVVTGPDMILSEITAPTPPGEDQPVPYDQWNVTALDGAKSVKLNTLLSQSALYNLPDLPCVPGAYSGGSCSAYASGAILLSGVVVPGQGIVPLGLTAGLDDPDSEDGIDEADGKLDTKNSAGPSKGQALLDYAPPHDGLEGAKYITIAIGVDIDTALSGGLAASTVVHVTDKFSATNTFSKGFVQQQGGVFDPAAKTMTVNAVGDSDFFRLNVDGEGGGEWNIYFEDAPGAAIDLNALRPAGVTGRDEDVDVQAFTLGNGGFSQATSFSDLVSFNGTNIDEGFVYLMAGWASTTCAEPTEDLADPFCEKLAPQ